MNDKSMNRTRRASAWMFGMALALLGSPAMAQVSLEMQVNGGTTNGPTGNGPSIATQVVTLRNNTNNPTGNTFSAYTPALTVTYSLSNQQFTGVTTPAQGFPTGTPVFFGAFPAAAANPAARPIYQSGTATGLDPSPSSQYTSVNASAGQGIDIAQNASVNVAASTRALRLANVPITSRVHMADLTLTFNRPVNDPVLHFLDIGGASFYVSTGTLAFAQDFELQTPGVTLTSLSGNAPFSVVGGLVRNGGTRPGTGCTTPATPNAPGACGSVRANGRGITRLTFRISMRSDGGVDGGTQWSPPNVHLLDLVSIGVSVPVQADLAITKTNGRTTYAPGQPVTYTMVARNDGPEAVTGARVSDTFPASITGVTWTCGSGTGGGTCGSASGNGNLSNALVNLPSGATVTFTATGTVAVGTTGNVSNTVTITGPATNSPTDPDTSNNSATDTDTTAVLLTLAKTWANAALNDAVTVSVTNPTGVGTPLNAVANTASETDTGTPFIVTPGSQYTLTEAFSTGIADAYARDLVCTGNSGSGAATSYTANALSGTVTIGSTATGVACTFTNTRRITDLSIEKTAAPMPATANGLVQFTMVVTNDGPAAADGAVVNDPAMAGLDCVEAGLPAPTCSATPGSVCPTSLTAAALQAGVAIPTLANAGVVTFGLTCRVTANGF